MNGNVVKLIPSGRAEIVDAIKEFAIMAEAGELRSVAIVANVADGAKYAGVGDDLASLLGAIELLKHVLLTTRDG